MSRTSFSIEIFGDRLPMLQRSLSSGDNGKSLEQIRSYLDKAIDEELTDRQQQIVNMFFYEGMSLTDISKELGLNKSTVSRHLARSKEKLRDALRYGLFPLWYDRK